jgi:hypothetical protein
MNISKSFNTKTTSGVFAAGLCMLVAQPCFAQSKACVNLLVGAGYAAWMAVNLGDSYYWSSSFAIGQTGCVTLPVAGMVNGAPYNVVVSAILGSSKVVCTPAPSPYSSSDTNAVVYNAWGTTFNVTCQMPGGGNTGAAAAAAMTPSKEGLEALEKLKKEGPKPAPQ